MHVRAGGARGGHVHVERPVAERDLAAVGAHCERHALHRSTEDRRPRQTVRDLSARPDHLGRRRARPLPLHRRRVGDRPDLRRQRAALRHPTGDAGAVRGEPAVGRVDPVLAVQRLVGGAVRLQRLLDHDALQLRPLLGRRRVREAGVAEPDPPDRPAGTQRTRSRAGCSRTRSATTTTRSSTVAGTWSPTTTRSTPSR